MTEPSNTTSGRGVSASLYHARWSAFEALPMEIREFIRNYPFPISAAKVKMCYDHCQSAPRTIEFFQAKAARRIVIDRALVWKHEELGASPIPPEPKMPRKARKSAETLTLEEIGL